jgi:phosphorylase/glycogen(starch) synthase
MTEAREHTLFEVSWEVCNKVGGIYTVITSKLPEATRIYGEDYFVLGPDLKTNIEFEETDEECWNRVREGIAIKEIPCRFGRWKVPGDPKAILVGFGKKYNKEQLLFRIWEDFGVDSIAGGWDYVEPVMFSYAASEVIETIYNLCVKPRGMKAVAQFHEWMTGAGLLGLKKRVPEIGTVFTTHATILGRTLAGSGMDIYTAMDHISPQREASAHNITAKCSMETASAREADCFTTVSEITAREAKNFLGRAPDLITPNGLDMENIPDLAADRTFALKSRNELLAAAGRVIYRDLPADTRIMVISGRGGDGVESDRHRLSFRPERLHRPDPLSQDRRQARPGKSAHLHPPVAVRGLRSHHPGLRTPRSEEFPPESGPGHLRPRLSQRS